MPKRTVHLKKISRWKECSQCLPLIQLANEILEHGICQVSNLFQTLFPNVKYQSDKAIRKLMQLPVVIFELELQGPGSQKLFVAERYSGMNYLSFSKVVQQFLLLRNMGKSDRNITANMPKESLLLLCNLASSEADRLLIKYTACKSMGLSAKSAKTLYGFRDLHKQEERIMDAIETTYVIRKTIAELAKAESTASLNALGIHVPDDSESDSDSMEESECCVSNDFEEDNSKQSNSDSDERKIMEFNEQPDHTAHTSLLTVDQANTSQPLKESQGIQLLPTLNHMLSILRRNKLNWFALVEELNVLARERSPESIDQLLTDFALFLSSSDATVEEKKLIEESRQAYLETERIRYNSEDSEDIQSDSDSDVVNPDDWLNITELNSEAAKEMIIKQRKIYKRKKKRRAIKAATNARLLRRRLPSRVASILLKYPNIGEDIETFVKERKVGADAWRRTGVLTFTYGKTSQVSG